MSWSVVDDCRPEFPYWSAAYRRLLAGRRPDRVEAVVHRLAVVLQPVVGAINTECAEPVAVRNEPASAGHRVIEALVVERLLEHRPLDAETALGRDARFDIDDAAHGVAPVLRRERPVHYFHEADFVGRHERPARRAIPLCLQEVMKRNAVREHHRTRRLEHVRAADAHRAVGVADVAAADDEVGFVLDKVLGRRSVDADQVGRRQQAHGV